MAGKRIGLMENYGRDFLYFRVPLAHFLEKNGYEVYAIIPDDGYSGDVVKAGVKTLNYPLKKNSLSPFHLLNSIISLRRLNRKHGFDIIHSFRLQPNIILNLGLFFNRRVTVINHITGLGHAFTGKSFRTRVYKLFIVLAYKIAFLRSAKVIVQNPIDHSDLSDILQHSRKLTTLAGSGIDTTFYSPSKQKDYHQSLCGLEINEAHIRLVISFTGRLLVEKGIVEFLDVAERLLLAYPDTLFVIAGAFDVNNPSGIDKGFLDKYTKRNNRIIYLGEISNIKELLSVTDIFVLPTYREGFSRSILEAMSMGLPVVTTSVPGASEPIIHDRNGLVVAPRDVEALKDALEVLINDKDKRTSLGENGRADAVNMYSTEVIYSSLFRIYETL